MKQSMSLVAAVAVMAVTSAAYAADALKMIIPTAVGGGTDGFFRVLAKEAEPLLKEPIVIVNVAGAGGTIGLAQMVRAAPDGLTVAGVWLGPVTVSPNTMKVTYKPEDYVPVVGLSSAPFALCVKPDFPASNGKELIEQFRANPGKITYGTDGSGGPAHLGVARILAATSTKAQDVPFKGAGETITAFLGGHIDIYVGSVPPVIQHVKAGKAKCVLVTSAERIPGLPDTSSLKEIGLADEETILWRAVLAPKGTPPARLAQLESAFERAANTPATKKFLDDSGEVLVLRRGPELRQFIDKEYAALAKVAKGLGMEPK